jgi:hypothetical protein
MSHTIQYIFAGLHGLLLLFAIASIPPIVYMMISRTSARTRKLLFCLLLPTPIIQIALGLVTIAIIILQELGNTKNKSVVRTLQALSILQAFFRTAMLALYFYMIVFITRSLLSINRAMDSLSDTWILIIRLILLASSLGVGLIVLPVVSALNIMNDTMNKSIQSVKIITSAMAYLSAGIGLMCFVTVILIMIALTIIAWRSISVQSRKHMRKIIISIPIIVLVTMVFAVGLAIFTSVVNTKAPLKNYLSFLGFSLLIISDLAFVFLLLFVYGPVREVKQMVSSRFSVQLKMTQANNVVRESTSITKQDKEQTGYFVITVEDHSTDTPYPVEVLFVIDPYASPINFSPRVDSGKAASGQFKVVL